MMRRRARRGGLCYENGGGCCRCGTDHRESAHQPRRGTSIPGRRSQGVDSRPHSFNGFWYELGLLRAHGVFLGVILFRARPDNMKNGQGDLETSTGNQVRNVVCIAFSSILAIGLRGWTCRASPVDFLAGRADAIAASLGNGRSRASHARVGMFGLASHDRACRVVRCLHRSSDLNALSMALPSGSRLGAKCSAE